MLSPVKISLGYFYDVAPFSSLTESKLGGMIRLEQNVPMEIKSPHTTLFRMNVADAQAGLGSSPKKLVLP